MAYFRGVSYMSNCGAISRANVWISALRTTKAIALLSATLSLIMSSSSENKGCLPEPHLRFLEFPLSTCRLRVEHSGAGVISLGSVAAFPPIPWCLCGVREVVQSFSSLLYSSELRTSTVLPYHVLFTAPRRIRHAHCYVLFSGDSTRHRYVLLSGIRYAITTSYFRRGVLYFDLASKSRYGLFSDYVLFSGKHGTLLYCSCSSH